MDKIHLLTERDSGIASGVKAAALVVILGVFAAIADHTMLASRAVADGPVVPAIVQAEASATAPVLPDGLRAHAGDVPPHIEAF